MTPPDSGDKPLCIVCWLPATRGLPEDGGKLYWCDKHGPFYDKPDSGEREVCGAVVARVNGDPLECEKARGHDGAHEAKLAGPLSASGGPVLLSLDLAQRILAALESHPGEAEYGLAAELRALVTR